MTGSRSSTASTTARRMWVVWSVALAAYIVGVMHRTSFGVAGLDAAQRFHAGPAALSGFVVLQLLVYAALQVPVGLLLDRFGRRRGVRLQPVQPCGIQHPRTSARRHPPPARRPVVPGT